MKYNEIRRKTKPVMVGGVGIGGNYPIAIQSMTNTDPLDYEATYRQIRALSGAGCDIVRVTVPTLEAAEVLRKLKESDLNVPLVADIHFDYRIALKCAEYGVDKIRINPGNIGDEDRVRQVCAACKERHIPIRIGVNSGSLEKRILSKFGAPCAEALCESALFHTSLLEKNGFEDIVISIKSSDVKTMIDANQMLADKVPYPLHLGVTEAGSYRFGSIKGAMGIGALLAQGIGDTLRVSLTDDPLREVYAARDMLCALGVEGQCGIRVVSCPTCGRTKINLIELVKQFESALDSENLRDVPITVAMMGCIVNGPGEAREADLGVAGGIGEGMIFAHGETLYKVPEEQIISELIAKIKQYKKTMKK